VENGDLVCKLTGSTELSFLQALFHVVGFYVLSDVPQTGAELVKDPERAELMYFESNQLLR
jgi:hypothetical protein